MHFRTHSDKQRTYRLTFEFPVTVSFKTSVFIRLANNIIFKLIYQIKNIRKQVLVHQLRCQQQAVQIRYLASALSGVFKRFSAKQTRRKNHEFVKLSNG